MNPLFRIDFSISDSLKIVRKSVLIYDTIIDGAAGCCAHRCGEHPGDVLGVGKVAEDSDGV